MPVVLFRFARAPEFSRRSAICWPMPTAFLTGRRVALAVCQSLQNIEVALLAALGVPFLLLMIAAIIGNIIQHRLVWSIRRALTPKFSKSLAAGRREGACSPRTALANFLKGLVKPRCHGRRGHGDGAVAGAPSSRCHACALSPVAIIGVDPLALAQPARNCCRHSRDRRRGRLLLPVPRSGSKSRRCRCRRSRKSSSRPKAIRTSRDACVSFAQEQNAQAHDGGRADCVRRHHQPDPLRGRAEIRARHGGADLRRRRASTRSP